MLPPNVIALISEYSKPCTPCNWKKRSWFCVGNIYAEIENYKYNNSKKYYKNYNLYLLFRRNVQNNYSWYTIYNFYLKNGIVVTSNVFNIKLKIMYVIINNS